MYRGGWTRTVNYWPRGWANSKSNRNGPNGRTDGQTDIRTNGRTDRVTDGHKDQRTVGHLGKHSVRLARTPGKPKSSLCVFVWGSNVKFDKLWNSLAATERTKQSFGILCIFLCQKFNTANYPSSISNGHCTVGG